MTSPQTMPPAEFSHNGDSSALAPTTTGRELTSENGRAAESSIQISVVIPVRDEESNIPELIERLTRTLTGLNLVYEIIFVIDLNRDRTPELLHEYHLKDPRIKILKLSRSFGQYLALIAGLEAAQGATAVIMDGDLQDYPEDIALLYARMREGYDVVMAVKDQKHESWIRWKLSLTFQWIWNKLADEEGEFNTSVFRILSRRTIDELLRYREQDMSISGILTLIGFPTTSQRVSSGYRKAGHTKYSYLSQITLAINFMLSFSTKPIRLISLLGLCISTLSLLYMIVVFFETMIYGMHGTGYPTIVSLILFLGGAQLLGIGIIGEYIGRIFIQSKRRPLYIVEKKTGDLK